MEENSKSPAFRKTDAGSYFCLRKMVTERMNQRFFELLLIGLILIFALVVETEVTSSSADSNKQGIISVSFSTIDKGLRSGVNERKLLVIKSEKEWGDLWRVHKGPFLPKQPIPGINFKQDMIVAVFSGEKKTGGYGIEITKIEEDRRKGVLTVLVLETQPPAGAIVTQALTQPYHVVKTARTDFTVKFIPEN